jgi:magnesium-transporting ATPase (P-type)
VLLLISIFLAIICYLVAERKRESDEPIVTTAKPKGDAELSEGALNFYSGIMLGGVLAGFFVSTLLETLKALWDKLYDKNFHTSVGIYWAFMFILSSIIFFQIVKWVMKRLYQTPKRALKWFDIGTLACFILGLVAIAFIF